jgi:UDP-2-acetamido-3-amino-2,3-dideoxy-glucuronate N-acetyltransferase
LNVEGARLIALGAHFGNDGGNAYLDFEDLPFVPRRLYTVHGVPSKSTRGNHAHRQFSQLFIASSGSCEVVLDDVTCRDEVLLGAPSDALLVPSGIWTMAKNFSPGAVLTILSSGPFEPMEFIKTWEEFLRFKNNA